MTSHQGPPTETSSVKEFELQGQPVHFRRGRGDAEIGSVHLQGQGGDRAAEDGSQGENHLIPGSKETRTLAMVREVSKTEKIDGVEQLDGMGEWKLISVFQR